MVGFCLLERFAQIYFKVTVVVKRVALSHGGLFLGIGPSTWFEIREGSYLIYICSFSKTREFVSWSASILSQFSF